MGMLDRFEDIDLFVTHWLMMPKYLTESALEHSDNHLGHTI